MGLFARQTKVKGRVVDANTKLPIVRANVLIIGSNISTTTNSRGLFYFDGELEVDSLLISSKGYMTRKVEVNTRFLKSNTIYLEQDAHALREVIITAKIRKYKKHLDPAVILFKKIIANKKNNNPDKLKTVHYEKYNKVELDFFKRRFKDKKMLKKLNFVFDYVDTSAITGKPALPFFFTETMSDVYISKNKPLFDKEIISASKVSGLGKKSRYIRTISQFTNKLYQKVNIYDNFIKLFDKGFVSPIANSGLMFYRYYITDSTHQGGMKFYQLSFRPITKENPAFIGDMWVADSIFVIQKIDMYITGDVNLNWIRNVSLRHEFQPVNNTTWYLKRQYFFIEFSLNDSKAKKFSGLLSQSTTEFQNITLNPTFPLEEIFAHSKDLIIKPEAYDKDDAFWEENRPLLLTEKEKNIYQMIDSLQKTRLFVSLRNTFEILASGYFDAGYVEIGPWYRFLSFNTLEEYKISFGGKTSPRFSKRIRFKGYLDYAIKTEELKYDVGMRYFLNKENDLKRHIELRVSKDTEQLSKNSDLFSTNNILFSMLSRNPADKLLYVDDYKFFYFHEWTSNFSNTLRFIHTRFGATEQLSFHHTKHYGGKEMPTVRNSQISLNFRWTKNQDVIESNFVRYYLDTKAPIFKLTFFAGLKALGGDYDFYKIRASVYQNALINPIGSLEYILLAEKIYGKIPFLLLKMHEGNETYAYDSYAFNLMNYYEFVSDRYASIYAEHHFDGFIFNKIPLLKKTKWRTVMTGKILWGDLRVENNGSLADTRAIFHFPKGLKKLDKPYMELGVGIENIFKILRIDAVWRLSYLDDYEMNNVEKFSIRGMLQFNF